MYGNSYVNYLVMPVPVVSNYVQEWNRNVSHKGGLLLLEKHMYTNSR